MATEGLNRRQLIAGALATAAAAALPAVAAPPVDEILIGIDWAVGQDMGCIAIIRMMEDMRFQVLEITGISAEMLGVR